MFVRFSRGLLFGELTAVAKTGHLSLVWYTVYKYTEVVLYGTTYGQGRNERSGKRYISRWPGQNFGLIAWTVVSCISNHFFQIHLKKKYCEGNSFSYGYNIKVNCLDKLPFAGLNLVTIPPCL